MRRSLHAVLAAAVLLAACAGDASDERDAADTPAVSGAPSQDTAGLQTTPEEVGAATVQVTLRDDALALSATSVQPGLVSLNVANGGSAPHRFRLTGNGEEVETDELAPGADVMVTLNLAAGTYQAMCPVPGHNHGPAVALQVR